MNPYSTYRESKHTAFAWKSKLKLDYMQDLQGFCQKPMAILGYNLVVSKRDKFNKDFPVVIKTKCDLWPYPEENCDPDLTTLVPPNHNSTRESKG